MIFTKRVIYELFFFFQGIQIDCLCRAGGDDLLCIVSPAGEHPIFERWINCFYATEGRAEKKDAHVRRVISVGQAKASKITGN